jgi:hypothetical protein
MAKNDSGAVGKWLFTHSAEGEHRSSTDCPALGRAFQAQGWLVFVLKVE